MTHLTFGQYQVELTHPDKLLFPNDGISKSDLLSYYRDISQSILPHLRDRPLMMHRFPDGIAADGFYQKEIGDYFPEWIDRLKVEKQQGSVTHVVCNHSATLAYLVNQGCITTHVWLSRTIAIHQPDQVIFDLDPPGQDFGPVRQAAIQLRELLDELHVPCFLKTTGSRGLHVVVPIDVSGSFDQTRKFAQGVALLLSTRHPHSLTVEHRKEKRAGRLFIDTGRNASLKQRLLPTR